MEILKNIFSEFRDTTVLFVSHRIASAALADKLFVVDSGHIVESGTQAELLAANGVYSSMYSQNGGAKLKEAPKEFAVTGD
jgi:ABC-type multidrug transport system fused ATPase/permease subunit